MKTATGLSLALLTSFALADSPRQILDNNARAVVYIEIQNADMSVVDHGSGFVVSQDGYVVTAAHLKADPTQIAWAVSSVNARAPVSSWRFGIRTTLRIRRFGSCRSRPFAEIRLC